MKKSVFMMLAICIFAGCSKDDNEENKNILIPNESQLTQTVYADQITGTSGVSFTTTGAWTSSISESTLASAPQKATKAGTPNWISIDPASGDKAGSYTLNIELGANFTGEKRTAVINIICNGQTISIKITQNGKTVEGVVPSDHVTGLTLNKNSLYLDRYTSETLIGSIAPSHAANKTIIWSSSNESVATVDQTGKVTPNSWASLDATTTITAITQDGAKTALCVVTIVAPTSNGSGVLTGTDELHPDRNRTFDISFGLQRYIEGKLATDPNTIGVELAPFYADFYVAKPNNRLVAGVYTFANYSSSRTAGNFYSQVTLIDGKKQYPSGGTITVAVSGDTYTLTFNVDTDNNHELGKITGTYTGKLRVVE